MRIYGKLVKPGCKHTQKVVDHKIHPDNQVWLYLDRVREDCA